MNQPAGPDALIARLRDHVLEQLQRVIAPGSTVALVDYPNHANVGDTAIYLGERAALRALGCQIGYVATLTSYSRHVMQRRVGRTAPMLVHGGGNFGDTWPTFQKFRERLFAEQLDRRVVQLPQSVEFATEPATAEAVASISAHPDLHLLVRDRPSLDFCSERFPTANALLCPDAAFALGPSPVLLRRPTSSCSRAPTRRSRPRGPNICPPARNDTTGHAQAPGSRASRCCPGRLDFRSSAWACGPLPLEDPLERLYGQMAKGRMAPGLDALAYGRTVITDRLHGHVLCLLLGRPHILLDNTYGKNRRFLDEWTMTSPLVRWADTPQEALDIAYGVQ